MNRNDLGPMAVDRRDFLKFTGGGIAVFVALKDTSLITDALEQQRGYPTDFNAYLRVGEDGRVTVFSGKIEMGQGVETSQAQMAAEELGVSLDSIDMVLGDTDRCAWDAGHLGLPHHARLRPRAARGGRQGPGGAPRAGLRAPERARWTGSRSRTAWSSVMGGQGQRHVRRARQGPEDRADPRPRRRPARA